MRIKSGTDTRSRRGGNAGIKLVAVILSIPVAYFLVSRSIAYLADRPVYEGDRQEVRDCRECLGKGHDEKYQRDFNGVGMNCLACLGTGKIEVILPSPTHPTEIWGAVVDWKTANPAIAHECPKHIRMQLASSIVLSTEEKVIDGSLPGVLVNFKGATGTIVGKSNSRGRFHCVLPPGHYTVEVVREGFARLESTLDIAPLTAPIWLEKNKIQRERSGDERRSTDGLAVMVLLERPNEGSGMIRTFFVPE